MLKPAPVASGLVSLLLLGLAFLPAIVQAPSPAQSGPPDVINVQLVVARGADPNSDGLFANLLVIANVTGSGEGVVRVAASLRSASGSVFIEGNDTWAPFNASAGVVTQTFFVTLAGPVIRLAGIDGPYNLYLYADGWTMAGAAGGSQGNYVTNTTTTPAFRASSFAPPWANLSGPPVEQAVDADHDGLYDALVFHVPLQVVSPGPVSVYGTLARSGGTIAGTLDTRARFLTPGPYMWDLVIDGPAIRESRQSGPYTLWVNILFPPLNPGYGYPQISKSFPTGAYSYLQFAPQSAAIRGPITSSLATLGVGDPHGLYVVHVPLHVRVAGDYSVYAFRYFPSGGGIPYRFYIPTTFASRLVHLAAGDPVVDLDFSTIYLSRLLPGENFTLLITVTRVGGAYWDRDGTVWTEQNLTASSLSSRPLAFVNLTATVSGTSCSELQGAALDRTTRFFFMNSSSAFPGTSPGTLSLELYPGTFEVFVSGCGGSVVETLTVSGSENLQLASPKMSVPNPDHLVMTFPSWNRSVTDLVSSDLEGSYLGPSGARFFADFAGNLDGVADATELSRYLQFGYVYPFIPVLVSMDGSDDWPVTATLTSVQGAGPVTSTDPLTAAVRYDAPMFVAPIPGSHHRVTLTFYYVGSGFVPYEVEVRLPAGATGSLSMAAVAWAQTNLTAPVNVSARVLGPGSWILTPGSAPVGYSASRTTVTIDVTVGAVSGPGGPAGSGALSLPLFLLVVGLAAVLPIVLAAVVYLRRPRRPAS